MLGKIKKKIGTKMILMDKLHQSLSYSIGDANKINSNYALFRYNFPPNTTQNFMDRQGELRAILIAMKGHPGTGKSTLANAIAKTLKCPLVDKDHFRDSTFPIQQPLIQASSPTTATKLLNDLAYETMWRVVSTQLGLGLSVVVDSPLSKRAHLDRLLDLASGSGARVVVVECKPGDEVEWRRRLELRGGDGGGPGWHKPSTWAEMERLLEGYGGCWDYDVGEVPKLVLDTTAPVDVEELVFKVVGFVSP